ncbi:hypothetical protein [Streptomyces sp. NPDC056255]|uniref:effector-associated constant component EACC1 n=1 Tax=Streptomyces sp. NPDC056255 TaxID=3345764 RepID=UPI0035DF04B9
MQVFIEAAEQDDGGATSDLCTWLRQDSDVRQYASINLTPSAGHPGAMGAVEIINLVVGQGLTALNLALSYASWRMTRPTAPPITFTVGDTSITVSDGSEQSLRRIVELLERGEPQRRTVR